MGRRIRWVAMTAFLLASCGGAFDPVTHGSVTLIRHEPMDGYPEALGIGTLVLRDGCVAFELEEGTRAFVLWPPDYELDDGNGAWVVIDDGGAPVGGEGDEVALGGGWGDLDWALGLAGGLIPSRCRTEGTDAYFLTDGPASAA